MTLIVCFTGEQFFLVIYFFWWQEYLRYFQSPVTLFFRSPVKPLLRKQNKPKVNQNYVVTEANLRPTIMEQPFRFPSYVSNK